MKDLQHSFEVSEDSNIVVPLPPIESTIQQHGQLTKSNTKAFTFSTVLLISGFIVIFGLLVEHIWALSLEPTFL